MDTSNPDTSPAASSPTDPPHVRRHPVAIVGTGGIAHAHARGLAETGRFEIVAAVDVDQQRCADFCEKWDIPSHHPDLASLLDSEEVAVVHLCTPPGSHRPLAVEALERGVTVLCEKPPAMTLADMDLILAAEATSRGSFATVFQHRFGSAGALLAQLAHDGSLGQPMSAVCNTLWFRDDAYFSPDWRGKWTNEGGGPTMGHGIHQMDLMLAVLGPWSQVTAVAKRQARPTNTEDLSAAIVEFDNGAVATVLNSLTAPRESSHLRFDFARATVEVEHVYGYAPEDWRFTPAMDDPDAAELWRPAPDAKSGHASQFRAIADALDAGVPIPVTSDQSRLTMELVAAIYASAFEGRPVQRGDITPKSPFATLMDGHQTPWPDVKEPH
ncbi:Gfo/Idh/MocA family protein [Parenemella sanctibonifatiensis]|uniref:Gfo/Idh/MocA family protein n=1 Tax=Parenemella sanctibonifatiensis TaxID=2016505 RepID=UPI001E437CE9|nr:Gfo/Idh/MocA family oxidoreductase [Parenemella sanctibonifatiensis]